MLHFFDFQDLPVMLKITQRGTESLCRVDSGLIAVLCRFRSLFATIQRSGALPLVEPAVR